MKIQICAGSALATIMTAPAWAGTLIAGTSFENVSAPFTSNPQYVDSLGFDNAHALINNPDQPAVTFTPDLGHTELGFSTFWTPNGDGAPGLTDGQLFGVYNNGLGSAPDGDHYFMMSDTEGIARFVLDTVDLTGTMAPEVSAWLRVTNTAWEPDDFVHMYVMLDDGAGNVSNVTLLDTRGLDIDDLGIEGTTYNLYSQALTPGTLATFVLEFDGDVASEIIRFDHVQFHSVPAPGALAVFGLAGLSFSRRRRTAD
jgi:hypothetical protein